MLKALDRRQEISRSIAVSGRASVSELASRYSVTQETIRRDLSVLETEGLVARVHGGAIRHQTPLVSAESASETTKEEIALAAAAFVPQAGGSILIDTGSTPAAFGHHIAPMCQQFDWTIFTNSPATALMLGEVGAPKVHLLGGTVRSTNGAIVGPEAVGMLENLLVDVAFLGTNGVSEEHGFSAHDTSEATLKRVMIAHSKRSVVLCDSSKFDTDSLVTFAELAEVDTVVTDHMASEEFIATLEKFDVEVVKP